MNRMRNLALTLFVSFATISFVGCSGVSEEQFAELDALKAEVKALDSEVSSLDSEKTKLEREIAEKSAKLDQCKRDQDETKTNLKKISK